ncbi:uncharacterized protein G2W53_007299 [Senna tora]|uniref:Uncharacterized protein n=1 Tax=Senna tora TaxID=362788 RepID=A0A835CH68_9FABA|nr:uncharacterized protein G2W53_007299 [Senna tora]
MLQPHDGPDLPLPGVGVCLSAPHYSSCYDMYSPSHSVRVVLSVPLITTSMTTIITPLGGIQAESGPERPGGFCLYSLRLRSSLRSSFLSSLLYLSLLLLEGSASSFLDCPPSLACCTSSNAMYLVDLASSSAMSLDLSGCFGEPDEEILEGLLSPLHHILQAMGGAFNRPTSGKVGGIATSIMRSTNGYLLFFFGGVKSVDCEEELDSPDLDSDELLSDSSFLSRRLLDLLFREPDLAIITSSLGSGGRFTEPCSGVPPVPASHAFSCAALRAVNASSRAVVRSPEGPPAAPPSVL